MTPSEILGELERCLRRPDLRRFESCCEALNGDNNLLSATGALVLERLEAGHEPLPSDLTLNIATILARKFPQLKPAIFARMAELQSAIEARLEPTQLPAPSEPGFEDAREAYRRRFWLLVDVLTALLMSGDRSAKVSLEGLAAQLPESMMKSYLYDLAAFPMPVAHSSSEGGNAAQLP